MTEKNERLELAERLERQAKLSYLDIDTVDLLLRSANLIRREAALRAAGEPVAYAIYGIGAGKVYLHNAKLIADVESDEWKTDDDCLGDHWAGNEPLYRAAQPAPSASVRKGAQHGATIEDAKAAIERGEYSDLPPLGDSRRTPSPLMAAGAAAQQSSAEGAQVMVDRDLLRRMLGYARNASCPFSGQPEVENWHSRIDADCRYVDAILGVPALESVRTPPQPSRIDASARASETVDDLEDLVSRFSKALLAKLKLSRANGCSGWAQDNWEEQCQEGLLRHVAKGDPRDVAAYCAFAWHHGWPTAASETVEATSPAKRDYAARVMGEPTRDQINAAAEVIWNDRDARHGGSWSSVDPNLIAAHQTIATARAALIAAANVTAAAEPTREEIAAALRKALTENWKDVETLRSWSEDILLTGCRRAGGIGYEKPMEAAQNLAFGAAAAILALKPRGGQTREGGE